MAFGARLLIVTLAVMAQFQVQTVDALCYPTFWNDIYGPVYYQNPLFDYLINITVANTGTFGSRPIGTTVYGQYEFWQDPYTTGNPVFRQYTEEVVTAPDGTNVDDLFVLSVACAESNCDSPVVYIADGTYCYWSGAYMQAAISQWQDASQPEDYPEISCDNYAGSLYQCILQSNTLVVDIDDSEYVVVGSSTQYYSDQYSTCLPFINEYSSVYYTDDTQTFPYPQVTVTEYFISSSFIPNNQYSNPMTGGGCFWDGFSTYRNDTKSGKPKKAFPYKVEGDSTIAQSRPGTSKALGAGAGKKNKNKNNNRAKEMLSKVPKRPF